MLCLLSAVLSLCFVDVTLLQIAPKHASPHRISTMRRYFTTLPYLQQERRRQNIHRTATFGKTTSELLSYDYKDKWWATLRALNDNVVKENITQTQHVNATNATTERSYAYTMTDIHNGDEHYTAKIIHMENSTIIAKIEGPIPTAPYTEPYDEVETNTNDDVNLADVRYITDDDATVAQTTQSFQDTETETDRHTTEEITKKGFNQIKVRNLPAITSLRLTASTKLKMVLTRNILRHGVTTNPKNFINSNTEQYEAFAKVKSLIYKLKKVDHFYNHLNRHSKVDISSNVTSIYKYLNRIFKRIKYQKYFSYDTMKIIRALTNKSDLAAENVDRKEMNGIVDDYNRSLNIIRRWPDFNVSKIFDCSNITYAQRQLENKYTFQISTTPSYDEEYQYDDFYSVPIGGTTGTTWAVSFYPEAGHHNKPPDQFPYHTVPYLTRFPPSTHYDFMQKLREEMAIYREGYFVTFLVNLMEIVAHMEDKQLRLLCISVGKEYDRLTKEETYLFSFGAPFLKVLHDFATRVGDIPTDYTQHQAEQLSDAVRNRQYAMRHEITAIINYIDTLYDDNEGNELFKALELVVQYPNITKNPHEVLRNLSTAIFAPYRRLSGTYKRQVLIDSINREIERVNSLPVAKALDDDETILMSYTRRGSAFLVNKTRFSVVKREKSKFVKRKKVETNTAKNNVIGLTISFGTMGTKNVMKIKRFPKVNATSRIVDSIHVTKPAYAPEHKRFVTTTLTKPNKTSLEHFKFKHPKMYIKYMELKRLLQDFTATAVQTPSNNMNNNTKSDIDIRRPMRNTQKRFIIKKGVTTTFNNTKRSTRTILNTRTTPRNTQKIFIIKKELMTASNKTKSNTRTILNTRTTLRNPQKRFIIIKGVAKIVDGNQTNKDRKPDRVPDNLLDESAPNSKYSSKSSECNSSATLSVEVGLDVPVPTSKPKLATKKPKIGFTAYIPFVSKKTTKVHKIKGVNKPKYYVSGKADFKTFKNEDILKQKQHRQTTVNEVLDKLTAAHSSYSDEEDTLKFYLFDAMRHNDTNAYLKNARRFNQNPVPKRRINDLTSYSSEEVALKSNIYKELGFNQDYRRTNSSDIVRRVNDNFATYSTAEDAKVIQPVNELSSYSDEEDYLRGKLNLK